MTTPLATWHDFYLGTLSASAALMGLLFVAVSLHLRVLAGSAHPVLRAEARTVYLGYLGAFVSSRPTCRGIWCSGRPEQHPPSDSITGGGSH